MDKIIVRGLKIFAYHGVNPEEKQDGQNFVFDGQKVKLFEEALSQYTLSE